MIPILSETEARKLDQATIASGLLKGANLMENAGRQSARYFVDHIPDIYSQSVLVVSGKGNNGGDGIVMHHYLLKYGIDSTLLLMSESEMERDVIKSHQITGKTIKLYQNEFDLQDFSWIVDALFGIGLRRNISGEYESLIGRMNACKNVISIDIPSGIFTDTGTIGGCAIKAQKTFTMGFPKSGHFLNDGISHTGNLEIFDIGFREYAKDDITKKLTTKDDVRHCLQPHPKQANKYSRGKLVTLAGSKGMTGAAILACRSAYRTGCGIIRSIVPESLNSIFEPALIEIITVPIEDRNAGFLNLDSFDEINSKMNWGDVLICGPGLSSDDSAVELVAEILKSWKKPLVLDATGFEPLIKGSVKISQISEKSILSPHLNEFCRLFRMDKEEVLTNRLAVLESVSDQLRGRVLILKGAPTLILTSSGVIEFMTEGNPILATAGTGDVLSGILGGLLAQHYSLDDSAMIATRIHANAGNLFIKDRGPKGLVASDLINYIPEVYAALSTAP